MNLLLLYFAIPVAVIILSIVLQKILRCPWLVSATFFAIFLVITFLLGNIQFLILTIIYTIISYITAITVKFIFQIFCGKGIFFNNINAKNIETERVNADVIRTNKIIKNNNEEPNNYNNCNDCNNCNYGCNCNRNYEIKNNLRYR